MPEDFIPSSWSEHRAGGGGATQLGEGHISPSQSSGPGQGSRGGQLGCFEFEGGALMSTCSLSRVQREEARPEL